MQQLRETGFRQHLRALFRQCSALAILNTGSHSDNAKTILEAYPDFEVLIHQQDRGIRLELRNAPADAFVDGEMIASTRECCSAPCATSSYTQSELENQRIDFDSGRGITDYVSSTCCATPAPCAPTPSRDGGAGGGHRSAPRNTSTPRRLATSWAWCRWTSAPAAVPA